MWSNAGAGESSPSQRKRRRRPAPAASPIEASPKGGSLPSTAESSGAASPLRRPCRNCKTGSHIRERWRAMPRQNSLDRGWQLSVGGPAISARSSVISPAVKSIAALDPTGNADAMRSRLRSSPIDHGNPCDRSSGDRTPLCADAVGPARDVNTTARPNGYAYPTSLSAMSPPLASAVGRLRIPPMSTRIGELPRRRRRSEPCGRAVCRWPLSSLMANCQMISVSDHSALLRLAAICSRIHASTSDSIQPTARAPSRIGWGKLPSATRT